MIQFKARCMTNSKTQKTFYYPQIANTENMSMEQLVYHMNTTHHSPYSAGLIRGVLRDMSQCIRELVMAGNSVTLDGLCNFALYIKSAGGSDTADNVSTTNIRSVRMRASTRQADVRNELKAENCQFKKV